MKNWVRGEWIGRGTFGHVFKVIPTYGSTQFPSPTVVKTSSYSSRSLRIEKKVLDHLGCSPYIIKCYGDDHSVENGKRYYNIFLEYAAGGSLNDRIKLFGGRLPESYVRRCTRFILEGLKHVHANGFVHCDVKPRNILIFSNGDVKIADFGLAKKKGVKQNKYNRRGTLLFMSPESVKKNEYESAVDIWALGCTVVEMVTGKHAWDVRNTRTLLDRIGREKELPKIPEKLSQEGKDFLRKCFVKDPNYRWTAEMLLNHPFIVNPFPSPSPSPSPHMPNLLPRRKKVKRTYISREIPKVSKIVPKREKRQRHSCIRLLRHR
ncbi:Mitogen-activated protein kinase kinase kinase 17, partial [Mucuna pruriens]